MFDPAQMAAILDSNAILKISLANTFFSKNLILEEYLYQIPWFW